MAESIVRCSECGARLKVPAGKSAVRCPKCSAVVRVSIADEPVDEIEVVEEPVQPRRQPVRRREDDEDDEDDRPRRRSRRDDEDDEDDRPRARRRRARDDDYDDEDEDDRPRRRKRRREPEGEGPWVVATLVTAGCFFLTFVGAFLVKGTAGLAPGEGGVGGKLVGLGIGFIAALVLMPLGIKSVRDRHAYGRWGMEFTGFWGVATGFTQAIMGGLIGGFCLYGLLFTLINGR